MTDIFDHIVLPVADPDDAAATCEALSAHDVGSVVAVHVIEKAGGAPDKAGVEQREEYAEEIFAVVRDRMPDGVPVETEIAFDTDVADAVFRVAAEVDATAVVITPRGGSRWVRLLTGDVALSLVTENDRPVVVLPDVADDEYDDPVTDPDEDGVEDGATDEDIADAIDAADRELAAETDARPTDEETDDTSEEGAE
jgi:nucleotide-binding universal stress UspA family protein